MTDKVDMLSLLKDIDTVSVNKVMRSEPKCAHPLFKPEDLLTAENELARIVRYYFIVNEIGHDEFNALHRKYSQEHGIRSSDADRHRGNMRKSLIKEKITWEFLVSHLMPVLGLTLDHVDIVFTSGKSGETVSVSSLDVNDRISRDFPSDVDKFKDIMIRARDARGNHVTLTPPEK
jgi:hypothetical protein